MTTAVGFFGKLPSHADFVRRGLPAVVTILLDDWLQAGFGQADDPAATIAAMAPVRLASSAVAEGQIALGAIVPSSDQVGRTYVVLALGLWPHPAGILPEGALDAWDDWCARAEALLLAAHTVPWTADATQAALEVAARATVIALAPPPPFAVPEDTGPATATWRPVVGGGERHVERCAGLPRGDDFGRLVVAGESAA